MYLTQATTVVDNQMHDSFYIQQNASELSGHIQDWEHTRHLGACRALMDLQGVTQGECIPAECLSRNVIMYKLKYVHGGTLPE